MLFSFGIALWEMWTRHTPFPEYSFNYEVLQAVRNGERPLVPRECPSDYADLMTSCWHQDHGVRPTFSTIAERLDRMAPIHAVSFKLNRNRICVSGKRLGSLYNWLNLFACFGLCRFLYCIYRQGVRLLRFCITY